jgi:hypothetical protein
MAITRYLRGRVGEVKDDSSVVATGSYPAEDMWMHLLSFESTRRSSALGGLPSAVLQPGCSARDFTRKLSPYQTTVIALDKTLAACAVRGTHNLIP